jgi:WD40 repeat protein
VQGNFGTLSLWTATPWPESHAILGGHRGPVTAVAASPDGRLVASADGARVLVQDTGTGRSIHDFPLPTWGYLASLAFSPDGRLLEYRSASGLHRRWEVGTWKEQVARRAWERRELVVFLSHPVSMALSADGKLMATSRSIMPGDIPMIEIRDFVTSKQLATWQGTAAEAKGLVFSRDGTTLLSGGEDGLIHEWLVSAGKERRGFPAHKNGVTGLALSTDGWTLASAGQDGAIRLWERASGKERVKLEGAVGSSGELAFSPDGRLLASVRTDPDQPLGIWQVSTGRRLGVLRASTEGIITIAFSPDGRQLLSGCKDKTARIHDLSRFERFRDRDRVPLPAAELEPRCGSSSPERMPSWPIRRSAGWRRLPSRLYRCWPIA